MCANSSSSFVFHKLLASNGSLAINDLNDLPGTPSARYLMKDLGDGGWMATPANLSLSVDEDSLGDAERRHTTEQVAYVVFGAVGSITP